MNRSISHRTGSAACILAAAGFALAACGGEDPSALAAGGIHAVWSISTR